MGKENLPAAEMLEEDTYALLEEGRQSNYLSRFKTGIEDSGA